MSTRLFAFCIAGFVTTLAGTSSSGYADGQGIYAIFNTPYGIAVDSTGVVYVADSNNHRIRLISPTGAYYSFLGFPRLSEKGLYQPFYLGWGRMSQSVIDVVRTDVVKQDCCEEVIKKALFYCTYEVLYHCRFSNHVSRGQIWIWWWTRYVCEFLLS